MQRWIPLLLCLPAAVTAVFSETSPQPVQHRAPVLSSVYPQGGTPGATVHALVYGEHLDRAATVLFAADGITGRVVQSASTKLELELTIAPQARFGPHYFRIVSPRGASNVLLFRVGDQPHLMEKEPNTALDRAQIVDGPVTINGRLDHDGDHDFFQFRAGAGETWIFDLRAARNGNGLDAAMGLLDDQGRRLQFEEDVFIWDPFFAHTFDKAGEYIVVVQPTHRSNDPNFAYQLDIRRAPWLETLSPLALAPGATVEVTFHGAGLLEPGARLEFDAGGLSGELIEARGNSASARIRVSESAAEGPRQVTIAGKWGRSNPAVFLVDKTPPYPGGEISTLPVSITGTARYRQPERFWLQAGAGQRVTFEVAAQRYGSPVDSMLRVRDENGKQVAANDDGDIAGVPFNKDSRIVHTFQEAGRYQVEMRNLYAVTGENFPYRLRISGPEPRAELMLAADRLHLHPKGKAKLKVTAVRRDGFDGEIPLEITGLPEGVKAKAGVIPSGKVEGEIEVEAAEAAPGACGVVRVWSSAASGDAWYSARIDSGGGEGATFAALKQAVIAVAEKPRFSLEPNTRNVVVVRGGAAEFPLLIRWQPDSAGPVRFKAENLPPGVDMDPAEARPGAESVRIRLKAAGDAPAGRSARVSILGADGGGHTQAAPKITVQVD